MFTRDAKRVHLPIKIGNVPLWVPSGHFEEDQRPFYPQKADMCGATGDVCCGPIADIQTCLRQV